MAVVIRLPRSFAAAGLLHVSVAMLWISAVPGAIVAADSRAAVAAFAWLTAGVLLYVVVSAAAADGRRWKATAMILMSAAAAAAAYTVLQYQHLEFPDKVAVVSQLGQVTSAWSPAVAAWRPFPNSLATLFAAAVPLAIGLATGRSDVRLRGWAGAAAAGMAVALLLTASRGAWLAETLVLALAMGVVGVGPDRGRRRILPIAAGVVLAAATGLSLLAAHQAFDGMEAWPVAWLDRADRQAIQGHALALVGDFPIAGVGLGDAFESALARHALLIDVPFLTYGHHLLLDVWLEQGLLGLLALVTLAAAVVASATTGEDAALGAGFRGAYLGVVALLLHGIADARQVVDGWTWLPLFGLLGLMAARLGARRAGASPSLAVALTPAISGIAVAVWIWPVGAAWHVNLGGLAELGAATSSSRGDSLAAGEAHYVAALAADPQNATAHRRLGLLATARDQPAAALLHLETAAQRSPRSWPTRKALGLAYVWAGRQAEAEGCLRSLGDVEGVASELEAWSRWHEQRGQPLLALRAAEALNRLRPAPAIAERIATLVRACEQRCAER
jgi:hypothetical protein